MKKLIIFCLVVSLIFLLLFSEVYSYSCINQEDNEKVIEFKQKINLLSLKQDIDYGLTREAIHYKLKYFGTCR